MKSTILAAVALAGLLLGSTAYAQQASAPAGSTGQCKDGSYSSNATKRGACRGHKGVKEWYAASSKSESHAMKADAMKSSGMKSGAMTSGSMKSENTKSDSMTSGSMKSGSMTKSPTAMTPAAGGGSGKVWVNGKVYHCSGDKYYGTTKHGEYMSESEAKAKGAHAAHGKVCS